MADTSSESRKRGPYTTHDDFTQGGVYWLSQAGKTTTEISGIMGLSVSTVHTIKKRIDDRGTFEKKKKTGRPMVANERQLRDLKRFTANNPFSNFQQIKVYCESFGLHVSRDTIISYLNHLGFHSYWAAKRPRLSYENKARRLKWAKDRVNWTHEQWSQVVWSDESRFTVENCDGGHRVIRQKGQRYEDRFVQETSKFGKGSVMIWSCFHAGGFGPLAIIEGTMNDECYINILANEFHPWFVKLHKDTGKEFILREDGAPCHKSRYAKWWEESHVIRGFEYWPAQSPDLNPIEHVWWDLEKRLASKRDQVKDTAQLKALIQQEWPQISLGLAEVLVGSMRDRCQAVIEAKGGHTKY